MWWPDVLELLCAVGPRVSSPSRVWLFLQGPTKGFTPRRHVSLQVSKSACVLTTQAIMRLLKSKEAAATVDVRTWPTILDTGTCLQHL